MIIHPVDFQTRDIQGIISIVALIHYYTPGRLKLQSIVRISGTYRKPSDFGNTRRWLQKGEAPFPGYCRAPGSSRCLPLLCNCDKLREIWTKIKATEAELKKNKRFVT